MAFQGNPDDPRVRRTRSLLQQAMMDLLHTKSFQSITVQDVADLATVNRATFYAHFEDKYDLMDSVIRTNVRAALSDGVSRTTALSEASLQALCRTLFDFLLEVHSTCKTGDKQFEPMFETAVRQELIAFIADWLQNLSLPSEPDMDVVATVIGWSILGAGAEWSRGKGARAQTSEDLARQVVAVLSKGIGAVVTGANWYAAQQVTLPGA